MIHRQGAGQLGNSALAGAVSGDSALGKKAVDRGHIDDGTAGLLSPELQNGVLGAEKCPLEIDIYHLVVIGLADVEEIATDADGGVVQQNVHGTMLFHDRCDNGIDVA